MYAKAYNILIVDDNPAIHEDFRKILSLEDSSDSEFKRLNEKLFDIVHDKISLPNFAIHSALQGSEALKLVDNSLEKNQPYAVAFVDIRMPPGLDGIETIKGIWDRDPKVQAVICTAFSDYSWSQTIENLGYTDSFLILKKPFDNIAVRQLACALANKWDIQRKLNDMLNNLQILVDERTEELAKTLSLTQATLEATADGIIALDLEEKVVKWNKKIGEMWNIPESILISPDSNSVLSYFLEQLKEPDKYRKNVMKFIENPKNETHEELHLKEGRVFEKYSKAQIMEDKIVGYVLSFRDITERKLNEQKLKENYNELEKIHKELINTQTQLLQHSKLSP